MQPEPLPQLSPELVMILPPEVAAIARMTLVEPQAATTPPRAADRRRSLGRAGALALLYAAILALTVTPLALAMKVAAVRPAQRGLQVHGQLRSDRNDAH